MSNLIKPVSEHDPYGVSLTKRLVVPDAEKLLFVPNNVSQSGSITLVDYMGGDRMVERVATAGHGLGIFPENPYLPDFLEYLAVNGILEPFKSVQFKFTIQSSINAALEIVYEPMASVNEYSGRYSVMLDSSFTPDLDKLTKAIGSNEENAKKALELMVEARRLNYEAYSRLIGEEIDLARELARTPLEVDNDTKYFWKIDLVSLVDFIGRMGHKHKNQPYGQMHDYLDIIAMAAMKTAPLSTKVLFGLKQNDLTGISLTMPRDNVVVDAPLSPAGWKTQETRRVTADEFDNVLFEPQRFMENGFVQAVDYMGDDKSPVDSARVSYGAGTRKVSTDVGLTRYLVRHRHTTPIEQVEAGFEATVPVFVDPRQAGRHRTLDRHGFMGYVPLGDKFFVPPVNQLRHQSKTNRQGRGNELDEEVKTEVIGSLNASYEREVNLTQKLRELDVPEYIIRGRKGVGFFTRNWRCGDLHNWGHFFSLRLSPHAQKEIRGEAKAYFDLMKKLAPTVIGAFDDYLIRSVTMTSLELTVIASNTTFGRKDIEDHRLYKDLGFVTTKDGKDVLTREGEELKSKLDLILSLREKL